MPTRHSALAFAVALSVGTLSVHAAESAKGGGGGAAGGGGQAAHSAPGAAQPGNTTANQAPANNTPANNAPSNNAPANSTPTNSTTPNANNNPGSFNNAPGVRNANDPTARGLKGDQRRDRQGRVVYVPGYGYSNWNGDYGSPYWSTPGNWYNNDGYNQSPSRSSDTGTTPAPAPSNRPEEEAAQSEMSASRSRLAAQFESNDEVRAALRDVKEAQRAYDAAVAKSNREITKDPEYKQAEADKQQAAKKVEAVQATDRQPVPTATTPEPAPISPAVINAAQKKLNAASEVSAIAADHAQSDPAVVEARTKLETAADKLNGMKDRFDSALQADPQWLAAKQKLDAARSAGTR